MVDRWNFSFVSVMLFQKNMEQHLVAQDLARFPPADPSWESPGISLEPFNVLLHVGEEGHTEEVDIAYFKIPLYLKMFLGAPASFGGISTLRSSIYSKSLYYRTRAVYPFDRSPMMVDRWNVSLVFVRLVHRNM
jgi:hypothetical protein